jgi:hypothetical protein
MDTRAGPSIGATVRHARQLRNGDWVTYELTASRTVFNADPDDDIPEARRLGVQLQGAIEGMFAELPVPGPVTASFRRAPEKPAAAPPAPGTDVDAVAGPAFPETMECPDHPGQTMRARVRPNGTHFFSHLDESTGGNWCNYQPRVA